MTFKNKSQSWKVNFHKKRIIAEDKREMSVIGETLWWDVDEEFEMFVLEL
jgi:hypothetical protein